MRKLINELFACISLFLWFFGFLKGIEYLTTKIKNQAILQCAGMVYFTLGTLIYSIVVMFIFKII